MRTSREIRQQYIDFFTEKQGHTFVPSSPVVPHDDPTLLFANAGMNQFKDVFLGTGSRPYKRAANTQKCIRAGGKHNDLEDVGKDTYHHTFFEMLGNWSFGDYFKREAISWAWELLTEVWGLDKSRLHATVFGGDEQDGLAADEEAAALWREVTDINPANIHFCDKKDNFWEMGDTGPCGPCSEIHVDRTPDRSGGPLVNADDPRVMEIWNLVFIQFNRNSDGSLTALPATGVDTGMGFERVTAVLQEKDSNYDTDVFMPLFDAIADVTGARKYGGVLDDPIDVAYRVLADHVRCLTFALTDGALPGNEGRGYVLRRILRRAVRHGRQTLGMHEPFLHRLVPAVIETMGDAFPELRERPDDVIDVVRDEEESFGRTLDRGIALFNEAAKRAVDGRVSGDDAFLLYDTFGFPLDLTSVMAEERGLSVDVARFDERMERQRATSRAAAGGGAARDTLVEVVQQVAPPATEFVGNELDELTDEPAWILLFEEQGERYVAVEQATDGAQLALVTGRTPFYAEAGGQVGDRGSIRTATGSFDVEETIKVGEVTFHLGTVVSGTWSTVRPGETPVTMTMQLAVERRRRIMANHTMTHVLNHKLRQVLGDHVAQRGSLVDDEKTRFDFAHPKSVGAEQLATIERLAQEVIDADRPVHTGVADQEAALGIHGLRAVFGEKYPPRVRVVSIGPSVDELLATPDNEAWADASVEFCGGTHLSSTGEAGAFVVTGEEAIAKGIRRVTAVTGDTARAVGREAQRLTQEVAELRAGPDSALSDGITRLTEATQRAVLPVAVAAQLREEIAALRKRAKQQAKERSKEAEGTIVEKARALADAVDGAWCVASFEGADANLLRTAMDVLKQKKPETAFLLGAAHADKCVFVAAVPPELIQRGLKAGDWVRDVAKAAGGGGGGRPDMAQAGGKDAALLDAALDVGRATARASLDG